MNTAVKQTFEDLQEELEKRGEYLRDMFNLIPEVDFALMVDAPVATVQWWRSQKLSPRFVKLGKKVFYQPEDIDDWIAQNKRGGLAKEEQLEFDFMNEGGDGE